MLATHQICTIGTHVMIFNIIIIVVVCAMYVSHIKVTCDKAMQISIIKLLIQLVSKKGRGKVVITHLITNDIIY